MAAGEGDEPETASGSALSRMCVLLLGMAARGTNCIAGLSSVISITADSINV
jgi:hypothetical protein